MRALATAALAMALFIPGLARAVEAPSCPDDSRLRTQVGQLQSQLDDLRGTATPAPDEAPLYSLEGTISAVTGGRLWLQDDAGSFYRLALPDGVKALEGGRTVAVGQLPEGTPVRTTARMVNGDQVVQRIEVQPTPNVPTPNANPRGARR